MVDFHPLMVSALNTVLPTHYEMALTSKTETPCISYMESGNYADLQGDKLGYSRVSFQVKVWGTDIAELQTYAAQIETVLRPLGFRRTSSRELYDQNSAMIQKIMSFEALALEKFE